MSNSFTVIAVQKVLSLKLWGGSESTFYLYCLVFLQEQFQSVVPIFKSIMDEQEQQVNIT